ncbi:MAG: flagellar basal body rod protein FlgB [Acidobacteria bacterium]|nr:MAG: flagellar basal body rod protein FlgB [Acidobacteriota bacterium]
MTWGLPSFDPFLRRMERALDVMSRRQQLTAANIANIDTPGYHTVDIDFDRALQRAVEEAGGGVEPARTRPGHLAPASSPSERPREVEGLMERIDGNNVNLDREMLALAQVRLRYDAATALLRIKLRQLRSVISEGRIG